MKLLWLLCLTLPPQVIRGQRVEVLGGLTPPYFNIAENRKVTVNATCGEGIAVREVYCKLVGFDRFDVTISKFDILDGQVMINAKKQNCCKKTNPFMQ